jgi:hypothetical protein
MSQPKIGETVRINRGKRAVIGSITEIETRASKAFPGMQTISPPFYTVRIRVIGMTHKQDRDVDLIIGQLRSSKAKGAQWFAQQADIFAMIEVPRDKAQA